jgi:YtkA-like
MVTGKIHCWIVEVTTPDGKPVEHADFTIDGGMPQDGHGLPTEPKVTAELGGGRYQVEGMKFNMSGWWTVNVSVNVSVKAPAGLDTATFTLIL